MDARADRASHWWSQPLSQLWLELGARPEGLSGAEARRLLQRHGLNEFRDHDERSPVVELARRFGNPLVLILIAASVVAAATGDLASFALITLLVLTSVVLDFVQEYRAGKAARRLQQAVQVRASVLRDGVLQEVPGTHVVPGDIVALRAGSLVPADGRLIEGRDVFVNQAVLTGEAFPVEKRAIDLTDAGEELQVATNALFTGTWMVSGSARLLVCRTGAETAIAAIAHTLALEPPPTAFDIGVRRFGMLIMRLTVLMVLFVLLVNTASHKPLLESFLFAIALAVGLTPELLPMIVSVTLAHGAMRMARKRVIVKRLASIQDLGSMDVLCTDKTGTLTEAAVSLDRHLDPFGADSDEVLTLAYLNSAFETGIRSALDDAILAHEHVALERYTKIDEVPFDFERRRVSVLVDDGLTRRLVVKGAPEDLLRLSSHYRTAGGEPQEWTADARAKADETLATLGSQGLRVLGIGFKNVERSHPHAAVSDETKLVFAGFAAFLDPPKASAAKALAALAESRVAIKILTGDNEHTTKYVCAKLGLPVTGVLTGADVAHMSDAALQANVERANLFCRMSPTQKNRVILALKRRGRVVGYLGDGINDAPALHVADVGISVNSAVDVAKEAASLILLKHDLHVVHDAVIEGRRTFTNVRKYIMMGTSSNFGNMLSMAGAALFLPFLPMLPAQILLNNVLYDISEIAIPLDHVDADDVRRPQQWDMDFIRRFMWVLGPVSTLFDCLTFVVLLAVLHAGEGLFQAAWFIESLASQVLVIFVLRTRGNPLRSRAHPALVASSVAVLLLAFAVPFTPFGAALGFDLVSPAVLAIVAALVAAYLVIVEGTKRWFYAHESARGGGRPGAASSRARGR